MSNGTVPLSAVVVGAGAGGTLSIDALERSERFTLTAVADLGEAARARIDDRFAGRVRTYPSAEEMFAAEAVDVVCVSTYAPTHLPLVESALALPTTRGLLVEKPLGDTTAAGAEILRLIRAHGLPVVVPHGLAAQAAPSEIVSRVHRGDIGRLRLVEIECNEWDIINAGIHWLQFFVSLIGDDPIESVLSAADTSTGTFRDGMQVETEAVTLAHTRDGVRLVLETGDHIEMARMDTVALMRIVGDRGFIEYGAYERAYTLVTPDRDREVVTLDEFAVSGHQRHLEHLAAQIEAGTTDYAIPDSSLRALEAVEAAYLSHRARSTVRLPLADHGAGTPWAGWDPGAPYSGTGGGRNGREL
ncbi:Gfo/Idh/MocA family oxidoreductase [Leifsonia shinshuensis]|uniref:Gfo/Idh/MocA family protein n=1 Tax=Leifsonia shinshuensis TaxID=150026 RepID=UPI001F50E8D2|nr:Gfo/Idh/MocA family oxidoreductase [Leifsonia shinshuensis]MCI0157768.1 Gfo/Idh/MocA family oxidoreductase [Leifsonia shinshuensis]